MLRLFLTIFSLMLVACNESKVVKEKQNFNIEATLTLDSNKFNGASLVSTPSIHQESDFEELLDFNFNAVALSPFAFIRKDEAEVIYNTDHQWLGELPEGIRTAIDHAKGKGLKIMLKPQLWGHGIFTGDIQFQNDSLWTVFEESYSNFLLQMANIAEEKNVDLFCIGTELATFVNLRPQYWRKLIIAIKDIYKGKLTYAENWDSFSKVPFWESLDYIGVDAYFPLSQKNHPSVQELNTGWKIWIKKLRNLAEQKEKSILFTEWGYRSSISNALAPWEHGERKEVSVKNQLNAYKSYYQSVYNQDWFSGGFLWKWFPNFKEGQSKDGFTPQHKSSAKFLKELKMK